MRWAIRAPACFSEPGPPGFAPPRLPRLPPAPTLFHPPRPEAWRAVARRQVLGGGLRADGGPVRGGRRRLNRITRGKGLNHAEKGRGERERQRQRGAGILVTRERGGGRERERERERERGESRERDGKRQAQAKRISERGDLWSARAPPKQNPVLHWKSIRPCACVRVCVCACACACVE